MSKYLDLVAAPSSSASVCSVYEAAARKIWPGASSPNTSTRPPIPAPSKRNRQPNQRPAPYDDPHQTTDYNAIPTTELTSLMTVSRHRRCDLACFRGQPTDRKSSIGSSMRTYGPPPQITDIGYFRRVARTFRSVGDEGTKAECSGLYSYRRPVPNGTSVRAETLVLLAARGCCRDGEGLQFWRSRSLRSGVRAISSSLAGDRSRCTSDCPNSSASIPDRFPRGTSALNQRHVAGAGRTRAGYPAD